MVYFCKMIRLSFIALLLSASALPLRAEVIRSADVLNERTRETFARREEVEIEGTVQPGSGAGAAIVADVSGRVCIRLRDFKPLAAGAVVNIIGYTYSGELGKTYFWPTKITVLRQETAPGTVTRHLSDIDHRKDDWLYLQTEGVVIETFVDEVDPRYFIVLLRDGTSVLPASIFIDRAPRPQGLIDARVRVTGVFKRTTKGFRKFFGPFIALGGISDLSIVTPPPANPYDIPELTDAPYIPADQINSMGKHRISGEVLAVWQGDRALLRAADGRAVNLTFARGFQPPPCGTRITAIGYPETDMVRLGLTKASFRVEPSAPQTNDTPIVLHSDADFISSQLGKQGQYENHGALVSLRGLLQSPPSADRIDNRMFVNVSGTTVPVDMGQHPDAARDIPAGSLIEVTGRFIVETDPWRPNTLFPRIRGISVVIRSPDDIRVISRPPWWTPSRLLALIGVLIAALVGIYIWNRFLNHLVNRRGRELFREQFARATSELRVEERTRLAVELHDSISQNLSGASLQIDAARNLLTSAPALASTSLDVAARTLVSCRAELRNCIWDLRNRTLEAKDMNEAIRATIERHTGDANATVRFNVPRSRLTDNTTHEVLSIIRELTVNAVRHGKAGDIRIAGALEGGRLLFSVSDNGCGFDPKDRPGIAEGHFGLGGVAERIRRFAGKMDIESTPGRGTRIAVSIRLPDLEEGEISE